MEGGKEEDGTEWEEAAFYAAPVEFKNQRMTYSLRGGCGVLLMSLVLMLMLVLMLAMVLAMMVAMTAGDDGWR